MKNHSPAAPSLEVEFARFAGELAESLSFNKSVGQIFGLLYLSSAPLSLPEIAERLSMSKGNASINIRLLESWGAVRPVSVVGSRKDFYEANRDIKQVALRRVREGLTKRLDRAEEQLTRLHKNVNGSPPVSLKRIQDLQSLITKARKAMVFISQWIA
jgi:DNA-binding transcriptional regulator GbsR (MarR family)